MTLPPDPFDGRISQDQLVAWADSLLFPVVKLDEPIRRRNRKIAASAILAALGLDTSARRHCAVIGFYSLDGSPLPADLQDDLFIPWACEIEQVVMLADLTTTAVADVWLAPYADYPPTNTESITAAAPPSITAGLKSSDATLTGWTKTIPAQSTLRVNLDSNDNAKRLRLFIILAET